MHLVDQKPIITLGITGSIAAYKSIDLIKRLQKQGFLIDVIVTKDALRFVTRTTLELTTGRNIFSDKRNTRHHTDSMSMLPHIALAHHDVILVAPATANSIAKFAHGIADNMLLATFLASTKPKIVVPAMNPSMYSSTITQNNLAILKENGVILIEPEEGKVACGIEGKGRFPQLDTICKTVLDVYSLSTSHQSTTVFQSTTCTPTFDDCIKKTNPEGKQLFTNKNILITTGGTREYIDPVRFLGNASTGTLGYYLAKEFLQRGATVTLVGANCSFPDLERSCTYIPVISADDVYREIYSRRACIDMLVMVAAVSDYTPGIRSLVKIKKDKDNFDSLPLRKTPDILKEVAVWKRKGLTKKNLFVIGSAAETDMLEIHAQQKLIEKNLDMIVVSKIPESFGDGVMHYGMITRATKKLTLHSENKEKASHSIVEAMGDILRESA